MISEIKFKSEVAIKLENDVLSAVIIPALGGKIASIYRKDKDFELLFPNKDDKYKRPKLYSSFSEFDAAGFDDAFPTIDESKVEYKGKKVVYPDHGEIWSADFNYEIEDEKVILTYNSQILAYSYKKTVSIDGDHVSISYDIENTGKEQFPCIWAMHCLVRCEEDMEIIFPRQTEEVINVTESKFLGSFGSIHKYPVTTGADEQEFHLNKVMKASAGNAEKYYAKNEVKEGFCGIYYPSKNIHYNVYFEKDKLPYLGFWVTEGGFRGDYNCALEPTNGYFDSIDIAKKQKRLVVLKAGENLCFNICIELK